jgi:hypothetical protein
MALFPACPLPACLNLTSDPRQPCEECLAAFGPRLRPAGEPVTAAEFTALIKLRDEEVQAVLAERRQMTPLPEPDVEWKQGQRCWVCEQRRKCRRDPGCPDRWICGGCLEMP